MQTLAAGYGYSGDPDSDLKQLEDIINLIDNIKDTEIQNEFRTEMQALKECALKFSK